ncbi:MAG: hypothetical protein P9L94_12735 [Candidatus Hinthialibacter antarcticus]|nr:hypothetical protein [Candidatus Hinthialibacter antarcticus]
MSEIIGEIIQTSTTEITGQSKLKVDGPGFGSLVCAGKSSRCVAVVFNVEVVGPEGYRKPAMTGIAEDQLPAQHPQLFALMRKQFQALLIGEIVNGRFLYGLPSRPPGLHAGVAHCGNELMQTIASDLGFFRLIYDSGRASSEELLLKVCINLLQASGVNRKDELSSLKRSDEFETDKAAAVKIGKELSQLYRDDYETLRRMMARLDKWLKN